MFCFEADFAVVVISSFVRCVQKWLEISEKCNLWSLWRICASESQLRAANRTLKIANGSRNWRKLSSFDERLKRSNFAAFIFLVAFCSELGSLKQAISKQTNKPTNKQKVALLIDRGFNCNLQDARHSKQVCASSKHKTAKFVTFVCNASWKLSCRRRQRAFCRLLWELAVRVLIWCLRYSLSRSCVAGEFRFRWVGFGRREIFALCPRHKDAKGDISIALATNLRCARHFLQRLTCSHSFGEQTKTADCSSRKAKQCKILFLFIFASAFRVALIWDSANQKRKSRKQAIDESFCGFVSQCKQSKCETKLEQIWTRKERKMQNANANVKSKTFAFCLFLLALFICVCLQQSQVLLLLL